MVTLGSRRRGVALMIAIVVSAIVGLAATALHSALGRRFEAVAADERRSSMQALADGGLAATLAGLAADGGFAGVPERSLGGGRVASRVVRKPGAEAVVVEVTATFAGFSGGIDALIEVSPTPRVVSWSRRVLGPPTPRSRRPGKTPAA